MKLVDLVDKYVVVEKRDGKVVSGILIDILNNNENDESIAYTTLVIRVDNNKFQNVHLIEVENIGEIE